MGDREREGERERVRERVREREREKKLQESNNDKLFPFLQMTYSSSTVAMPWLCTTSRARRVRLVPVQPVKGS